MSLFPKKVEYPFKCELHVLTISYYIGHKSLMYKCINKSLSTYKIYAIFFFFFKILS